MAASPKPSQRLVVQTRSSDETRQLAGAIAPLLVPGDVLVLSGDLGAGKTTFVQGLAKGLGIVERVTSPTFILMKEYPGGRFPLMHLDVYRLGKIQEVIDLGIDEYLDPSYVVAVEWGDRVEPLLPQDHLNVELTHDGADSRTIAMTAKGGHWEARMAAIRDLAGGLKMSRRAKEPMLGEDFQPGSPTEGGHNN
ncbi:MAG TPA: tRNA (adenosine(37)-N6)-threonylcarbamoyltransferase complex ATPase subunit type 1 TsaE [Actinomycetota bacterium]|nr:tRNA (adenosine(37)-N6)-threonylcarbamoyltransferase complex ATPase subunit type 1 TsaE [Actinomycetota bacterium]